MVYTATGYANVKKPDDIWPESCNQYSYIAV